MANSKNNKSNTKQVKEVRNVQRLCNVLLQNNKLYLNNMEATTVQATQIKGEIKELYTQLFTETTPKATFRLETIAEARPTYEITEEGRKPIGTEFKLNGITYYLKRSQDECTEYSVYDENDTRVSGVKTNFNEAKKKITSFQFRLNNKRLYLMSTNSYDHDEGYFSPYLVKEQIIIQA
jgi:hypothetical protein